MYKDLVITYFLSLYRTQNSIRNKVVQRTIVSRPPSATYQRKNENDIRSAVNRNAGCAYVQLRDGAGLSSNNHTSHNSSNLFSMTAMKWMPMRLTRSYHTDFTHDRNKRSILWNDLCSTTTGKLDSHQPKYNIYVLVAKKQSLKMICRFTSML